MSQRPIRHRRKPSQSVFVSFEDLSDPISDDKPTPSNQASPSQPFRASTPPAAALAPAETCDKVAMDGEKPKAATS
ncbi:hypothetical protein PTKIN_Ptkin06aG0027700 [Pterospermum kingtungense]